MKNKYLTPTSLIITAVALIILTISLVQASHRTEPFVPSHPVVPTTASPSLTPIQPAQTSAANTASVCYILNHPTTSGGKDIAYLKVVSSDGVHATGEFGTALDGKDAINGTLAGTLTSDTANNVTLNAQYNATGEGMNNVVEQDIKLSQSQAQIGYGEMVANQDGTYSYKNPSAVTYSLSLPSVSCAQYDSLKAATESK